MPEGIHQGTPLVHNLAFLPSHYSLGRAIQPVLKYLMAATVLCKHLPHQFRMHEEFKRNTSIFLAVAGSNVDHEALGGYTEFCARGFSRIS